MTSYSSYVTLLTNEAPSVRTPALSSLRSIAEIAPAKTRMLILNTAGMMSAIKQFLELERVSETRKAALEVLALLVHNDTTTLSDAEIGCKRVVFDSPLFPLIVRATTVHKEAFLVMSKLSIATASKKMIELPGVAEVLTNGLNANDAWVHEKCIITVSNIAYATDLNGYRELVSAIVDKITAHGVCLAFKCTSSRSLLLLYSN
jgi:hypothetical protein